MEICIQIHVPPCIPSYQPKVFHILMVPLVLRSNYNNDIVYSMESGRLIL